VPRYQSNGDPLVNGANKLAPKKIVHCCRQPHCTRWTSASNGPMSLDPDRDRIAVPWRGGRVV
jgi:hypothetical protein